MNRSRNLLLLVALSAVLFAACSTSSIRSTWKDPNFQQPPLSNIVVRVTDHDPVVRASLEEWFCELLKREGVLATSYRAAIELTAAEPDADPANPPLPTGTQAILLARESDTELTQAEWSRNGPPQAGPGTPAGAVHHLASTAHPTQGSQCELLLLPESKAIWTGSSVSHFDQFSDRSELLKPWVKLIVEQLKKDGMIP